jgi:hypothetical protein
MKKYLFIIGMTAMMMASCSSDDGTSANVQNDGVDGLDITALNSDVPITFGVINGEASSTRGTILSDELKADNVGIFMLARSKRTTWAPNWLSDNEVNRRLNVWLDNVAANIVYEDAVHLSKFVWTDKTQEHFYPSVQRYSYDFIGYYPRSENIEYTTMSGTNYQVIHAFIDIDGSDDILYSHATLPANKEKAYSSDYFKEDAAPETPHFQFSHKLARMQFKIRLTSDAASVGNFYVDDIYLEDMSYKMKLQIAYKGPLKSNGTVDINGGALYVVDAANEKKDFHLKTINNTAIADENYLLSDVAQPVGDAIMFFPSSNTLSLRVILRDDNGSRYSPTNAIKITAPEGGWKAGVTYPMSIKLADPVKVTATANLLDFDNSVAEREFEDTNE